MGKPLGPITVGGLVAILISMVIGVALLLPDGLGSSLMVWLVIAIILYMVPHVMGVKSPKIKVSYGIVFGIIVMLVGGAAVGPAFVNNNSYSHLEGGNNFHNIDIVADASDDNVLNITVNDFEPYTEEGKTFVPVAVYCEVNDITYNSLFLTKIVSEMDKTVLSEDGGKLKGSVTIDSSKLYFMFICMAETTVEDGKTVYALVEKTMSTTTLTGFDFNGSMETYTYMGALHIVIYILAIFFLIVLFTFILRRKINSTRQKMEDDGRLYPQGYGRCVFCGAIVLPGEVKCRKCNAYIDRPESMRRRKNDFFQCSECGAEVPSDAKECPKCGVKFDGLENSVRHLDGTVDVSEENKKCPFCDEDIPINSKVCPKCGRNL